MKYLKYISKKRLFLFYAYRIRGFFYNYKNLFIFLFKAYVKKNKSDQILFYGLQRSGTNILKAIMQDNGIVISNTSEYPANSNLNRHFRFRFNYVPISSIADYFPRTEVLIDSVKLPDCFIDKQLKYIISVRDFDEWIVSIATWGNKHRWFVNNDAMMKSLDNFAIDYIEYCKLWINLANDESTNIKIFPFNSKSIQADVKNYLDIDVDIKFYENKTYRGSEDHHKLKNKKNLYNKTFILESIDDDLRKQAKKLFNIIKFDLN